MINGIKVTISLGDVMEKMRKYSWSGGLSKETQCLLEFIHEFEQTNEKIKRKNASGSEKDGPQEAHPRRSVCEWKER